MYVPVSYYFNSDRHTVDKSRRNNHSYRCSKTYTGLDCVYEYTATRCVSYKKQELLTHRNLVVPVMISLIDDCCSQ